LEGHDDDEESRRVPAMKVNEKLHNNYITATERYSRPPARIQKLLWLKLEELELVVRQLMRLLFQLFSTIMLRKEI
jgi:hypothetical protein